MDSVDKKLTDAFDKSIGKERLKQLKRSQKAGKSLLPQWQVKNWKEKYQIK